MKNTKLSLWYDRKVLLILSYVIPYMSEETVTIPRDIIIQLKSENEKMLQCLLKLEKTLRKRS